MKKAFVIMIALALHALPSRAAERPVRGNGAAHPKDGVFTLAKTAEHLLQTWQLEKARELIPEFEKAMPAYLAAFYLGRIEFYSGEYKRASEMLDKIGGDFKADEPAKAFIVLVKNTLKIAGDFRRIESEHFSFRCREGKDEVLAGYALNALESALREIGGDIRYTPGRKMVVEAYPDIESFTAVSTLTKKEIDTSGTIALCKFNRLMITTPRAFFHGYQWMDTLAHELTHYLLSRRSNNSVPLWLHEGIAKFEEIRWRAKKGGEMSISSQSLLSDALKKNELITFEKMYPSFAMLPSQEQAQLDQEVDHRAEAQEGDGLLHRGVYPRFAPRFFRHGRHFGPLPRASSQAYLHH